jgi:hypothetical protein
MVVVAQVCAPAQMDTAAPSVNKRRTVVTGPTKLTVGHMVSAFPSIQNGIVYASMDGLERYANSGQICALQLTVAHTELVLADVVRARTNGVVNIATYRR